MNVLKALCGFIAMEIFDAKNGIVINSMVNTSSHYSIINHFIEAKIFFILKTHAKTEHKDDIGLMCIDHAVRKNKISSARFSSHFVFKFNLILILKFC